MQHLALWFIAASAAIAGPAAHAAEAFPARPVTLVTAFAPGSGPDAVLRLVAEKLGKTWNQRVLVDNKPGGGGFIAIDNVKRAAPDGYTLLQLDSEHLAALPSLYKSRGFQTLKTFEPVAALFRTPFLVAVPADSAWKSMADLSFASIPSSQGAYKAGRIRYLAVAAPRRMAQMPELPTVAEAGGPAGLDVNSFVVLVAPRGLPAEVRERINSDVQKALAESDVKARFDTFAFENVGWSPQEIERQAALKARTYADLVQRKNISLD